MITDKKLISWQQGRLGIFFSDNVIILFMDLAGFFLILFKTIIGNWFLTLNNCKNYMK